MYATYNITDDRLRLSLGYKPSAEETEALRKAGFSYWPGSKLNVTKWNPGAEDYILTLGIEIEEDDTPDDVEARVDRFSGYAENAQRNASSASAHAHGLLNGIPPGQPVLVGHHSERSHRSTLKRADSAMQRAVSETARAAHWQSRIAGAIEWARYRERPDVIARRIKKLEADLRSYQRQISDATKSEFMDRIYAALLDGYEMLLEYETGKKPSSNDLKQWLTERREEVKSELKLRLERSWGPHEKWAKRWIEHIERRLEYERALLDAMGGASKLKWELEIGGKVLSHGTWYRVLKINKRGNEVISVKIGKNAWEKLLAGGIEDYQPPAEGDGEKVKAAMKKPPLCNYPGNSFVHITKKEWERQPDDYKGARKIIEASEQYAAHRVRSMLIKSKYEIVFITDIKRTDPPNAK